MSGLVVISGCSSGGKSTLLEELALRGHAIVPEPGRRVVRQEMASGGTALPWLDTKGFVDSIVALATIDYEKAADNSGWTFFDRGLIDALSALGQLTGTGISAEALGGISFHRQVFMAPPWAEIYVTDEERKHSIAEATLEYERLSKDYPALGYEVQLLPKVSIVDRADFVEQCLGSQSR